MVLTVYLKLPVWFIVLIIKCNWVFYGCDKTYFVYTHSAGADYRHRNQAYLPGEGDKVMT